MADPSVITSAPAAQKITKTIETAKIADTMRTMVPGQEDVLMHVPLSNGAKLMDFSPAVLTNPCLWSWSWCFWDQMMRARSYMKVLENAMEYNAPSMKCLPMEGCVKDEVYKIHYDKMLKAEPYRTNFCTPYHWCGCLSVSGQVLAVAKMQCMANTGCQFLFCQCMPGAELCGLYKFFGGLDDAEAVAETIKAARNDFAKRKGLAVEIA